MNETLRTLVNEHGLAAVLATLGDLVRQDADELEELGDPTDSPTVETLNGISGRVVRLAAEYDAVVEGV